MGLIRTSLLNAIAVCIKMATLLGINKILAIYVGPTGYAALGQFQNAMQMITTFASGAINTGVTKYTAEYYGDEQKQKSVWKTAGTITLIGSLFASVMIILFNQQLALWFLKDVSYGSVFIWFAITLTFFTLNTLLLAILNGKKDIIRYVIANICGSFFSLLLTGFMAIQYGIHGALIALATYQSLSFFVTVTLCTKTKWFKLKDLFGKIDKGIALNLSKYTAMALTSAICVPLSQILIRDYIGKHLSWEQAGYWEAMIRLSGAYLLLVTTTLSVYYLPRLSEIKDNAEIKKEIWQGYKIIIPATMVFGTSIYILRDWIILLLFSKEFMPMRDLFAWQMIGDTIKIASWILAYVMLGKALVKMFIVTEILFSILFYLLSMVMIHYFGLEGATIAYALNYVSYSILLGYFILFKKLNILS